MGSPQPRRNGQQLGLGRLDHAIDPEFFGVVLVGVGAGQLGRDDDSLDFLVAALGIRLSEDETAHAVHVLEAEPDGCDVSLAASGGDRDGGGNRDRGGLFGVIYAIVYPTLAIEEGSESHSTDSDMIWPSERVVAP